MRPQFLLLRDQPLFSAKPPPTKLSWSDHLKNLALGLAALVTSIAIPLVGIYYTDRQKEREIIAANARTEIEQRQKDKELGKGFIELGTKILSETPTRETRPLRSWAVDVINHYAEVRIPDQVREALLTDQSLPTTQAPGPAQGSGSGSTSSVRCDPQDPETASSEVKQDNAFFYVESCVQKVLTQNWYTYRVENRGTNAIALVWNDAGIRIPLIRPLPPNQSYSATRIADTPPRNANSIILFNTNSNVSVRTVLPSIRSDINNNASPVSADHQPPR